ncbi:MAG: hypothetical protein KOO65_10410 [Desulfobacterales bacterium]|nr:hypothetical protein [Desulfobacterales bacterium]
MEKNEFKILFRGPIYPAIIISDKRLYSAFDIEELAIVCMSSNPVKGSSTIKVIDSTGEKFWFTPEHNAMSFGFLSPKWTKKKIIGLFNKSSNAKKAKLEYPLKSLSNKRLEKIITDICEALRS